MNNVINRENQINKATKLTTALKNRNNKNADKSNISFGKLTEANKNSNKEYEINDSDKETLGYIDYLSEQAEDKNLSDISDVALEEEFDEEELDDQEADENNSDNLDETTDYSLEDLQNDIIAAGSEVKGDNAYNFELQVNEANHKEDDSEQNSDVINASDSAENSKNYEYYSNLKAADGTDLFEGSHRNSKDDLIQHMLQLDPNSQEYETTQNLIKLVQSGTVGKHTLQYLPANGTIETNVANDINKLTEANNLGIDPKEMFIPTFDTENAALASSGDSITYKNVNIGDVFQLENEDKIRIKTSESESLQLDMTRDMYYKLFPPVERYGTTQNKIGNCYELTALNSMINEPTTRDNLLSLMHQDGNDVIVEFPNGDYGEIRYKNGELPEGINSNYHSLGAKGISLLECTRGFEIIQDKVNDINGKFDEICKNTGSKEKQEKVAKAQAELTEAIGKYNYNVDIDFSFDRENYDFTLNVKEYDGKYDHATTKARNGGYSADVFKDMGLDSKFYSTIQVQSYGKILAQQSSHDLNAEILKNPSIFEKNLVTVGTENMFDISKNNTANQTRKDMGVYGKHAYRLESGTLGKDGKLETFKLINPWGVQEVEITADDISKYISQIHFAKKE